MYVVSWISNQSSKVGNKLLLILCPGHATSTARRTADSFCPVCIVVHSLSRTCNQKSKVCRSFLLLLSHVLVCLSAFLPFFLSPSLFLRIFVSLGTACYLGSKTLPGAQGPQLSVLSTHSIKVGIRHLSLFVLTQGFFWFSPAVAHACQAQRPCQLGIITAQVLFSGPVCKCGQKAAAA